ncbi:MAG TPA: RNA polymerase subunit sigma-70, partial [Streptomyces sp.]|nr:RNA polymerase subunit sigma-70 [Streptomyces sp.]
MTSGRSSVRSGTDQSRTDRSGTEWYQQPLVAGDAADEDLSDPAPPPLTPDQAFDALYAYCAPALVQQTYLLTGQRSLAREAVERAFQL